MWELSGHNPDVVAAEIAYRHRGSRNSPAPAVARPSWRFWTRRRSQSG